MSPQARFSLPPALGGLTTAEMQRVIRQSNVGTENERIAQLYFVERRPQVDVAAELYLGRATVQRRIPEIRRRMERASEKILH